MTAAWTRPLSTDALYVITSNTTDPQNRDEAMAEIERREECCSDCFGALDDPDAHCQQCGDHVDGLGECQSGCEA